MGWTVRGSILGRRLLVIRYRGSFPGVKRPGREVNHSSPSSTEVKNKCNYASALPIYFQDAVRENFLFLRLKGVKYMYCAIVARIGAAVQCAECNRP